MSEEGRVGVLMCAGCAFVCLLLFVTVSLTQVAMQDRRLVSCADALAGAGVGGASASSVIARQESGIDEAGAFAGGGGAGGTGVVHVSRGGGGGRHGSVRFEWGGGGVCEGSSARLCASSRFGWRGGS